MESLVEKIKILREKTQAPIAECKRTLENTGGDITKAIEILNAKGFEKAQERLKEDVGYSIIGTYNHHGRIGVMVELACKTDFAAKSPEFVSLLNDLCLQVCAMNPSYITKESVPQEEIEEIKKSMQKELENKPPHIQE
ncbi:MAG: elongation factor Ts, partial [Planctomycetota bacterium]